MCKVTAWREVEVGKGTLPVACCREFDILHNACSHCKVLSILLASNNDQVASGFNPTVGSDMSGRNVAAGQVLP